MKLVFIILISVLIVNYSNGQITFESTFGDIEWDDGYSVKTLPDSSYIIGAKTSESYSFKNQFIKVDKFGEPEYYYSFNNTEWDEVPFLVDYDSDTSFILSGGSSSNFSIIKINTSGETLSEWSYDYMSQLQRGFCFIKTTDGGYIISGESDDNSYLVKVNSSGSKEWDLVGDNYTRISSVKENIDGSFIAVGFKTTSSYALYDVFIEKITCDGDIIWSSEFDGYFFWNSRDIIVEKGVDSDYVIFNNVYEDASTAFCNMIKVDEYGDSVWSRKIHLSESVKFVNSIVTDDQNYLLIGEVNSEEKDNTNIIIIKVDAFGNEIWSREYGFNDHDLVHGVDLTKDNGFIIVGTSYNIYDIYSDIYLLKIDANGNLVNKINVNQEILSIYPNPFTDNLIINSKPNNINAEISVYDTYGNKVFFNCFKSDNLIINTSFFKSGVYFVEVKNSKGLYKKKIIKL